jgi:glycosyltransferase involved in cell wall biosynthesis
MATATPDARPLEWAKNGMPLVPPMLVAVLSVREPDAADEARAFMSALRSLILSLRAQQVTVQTVNPADGTHKDVSSDRGEGGAPEGAGDAGERHNLALVMAALRAPRVYMSFGGSPSEHRAFHALPRRDLCRWWHADHPRDAGVHSAFHLWLAATDPLPPHMEKRAAAALEASTAAREAGPRFSQARPLVSVFTSSYRSGDKILRLYRSLVAQTYDNWELVVVDDSGDDDATYRRWLLPAMPDSRVRRLRPDRRSGYIGRAKREAAGACVGEVLVEADHDDALAADCLERIVAAFEAHRDCGFVFGETAEVFARSGEPHEYPLGAFGGGMGLHWRQWTPLLGRWTTVARTAPHHRASLGHLAYMPNHPRAWTADCYRLAGGHRPDLSVGDDYDLLVRTALVTRWARINELCYVQYLNDAPPATPKEAEATPAPAMPDNNTYLRNRQIQVLCAQLFSFYAKRLEARMDALGAPVLSSDERRPLWERPLVVANRQGAEEGTKGDENGGEDATDPWHHGLEAVARGAPHRAHVYVMAGDDGWCADLARARLVEHLERMRRQPHLWSEERIVAVGTYLPEADLAAAGASVPRGVSPGALRWWSLDATARHCETYGRLLACDADEIVVHDGFDPSAEARMNAAWGRPAGPRARA